MIPLHVLGVTDTDLSRVSSAELMSHALTNLFNPSEEGGYAVRHSLRAINNFGENANLTGAINLLAGTFPIIFPYGVGSIEAE